MMRLISMNVNALKVLDTLYYRNDKPGLARLDGILFRSRGSPVPRGFQMK
jgi:hypothetical protein